MTGKLLVANRGEIAVRIMRTAAEMGIATVAVHPADDASGLHVREADEALVLPGTGTAAYLAAETIVAAAVAAGCDAIHPGYGMLSENPAFARACEDAGLAFVGPRPETIELFGDKTAALAEAARQEIPVLAASGVVDLEGAEAFLASLGPGGAIMLKAVAGGGGRGMQPVTHQADLSAAFARCSAEAESGFGDGRLYAEQLLARARHVEVQVIGDGQGSITHLWDRECSLQRRRQKLVEIAPAIGLPAALRDRILAAAVALAEAANLRSLCTMEFLVDADGEGFAFMEANPRLQVEHTVTEEVLGLDLVRLQLQIAGGATLADVGLGDAPPAHPRGMALQTRVNLETMQPDGTVRPASGTISHYAPPAGRGVRTDGFGYAGYTTSLRYDPLLAKVVVSLPNADLAALAAKARRALADFRITGVATNIGFLRALLARPEVTAGALHTTLIDEQVAAVVGAIEEPPAEAEARGEEPAARRARVEGPAGSLAVDAPMAGVVVAIPVQPGDAVAAGDELAIVEAMKMQHAVTAPCSGTVAAVAVSLGETVADAWPLLFLEPGDGRSTAGGASSREVDLDAIRPDLAEVIARQEGTRDAARPDAVARRRKTGQRTARENIDDLCDAGSFTEYGSLAIAGRSRRASTETLIKDSPADGLVMGLATAGAEQFGEDRARIAVMSYDYTVFAGTQGARNHIKTDRLVELAERWKLPLVLFAEGGGGRPGDTDGGGFIRAFELFPKLSGKVPMVGVVSGRCFAGNAALLGCCDVIIATENVTMGMGGPAMIEGGGLGVYRPEEVGPAKVHVDNGVIDVLVADEAAAVDAARRYLGYFQGALADWDCADQRELRHLIPENRLRVYDIRKVIETLCDTDSVLELRRGFGLAMVTAFARIEGRPVGIVANDPAHLGGAIDSDAADKASRFMALCDAHGIPIVSLSDTPGIMVGPEVEKTGLVRHAARMFLAGANVTVPLLSVILRKSYGLGAIAMTGGSYQASLFSVSWPTGEFGGMGFEGAVKLGYKKELEAIADPNERQAKFDELVAMHYSHGKALVTASYFGIDDVIDPADTRQRLLAGLRAAGGAREAVSRRWVDSW